MTMPQTVRSSSLSCKARSAVDMYTNLWRSFTVCMDRVRRVHSKHNREKGPFQATSSINRVQVPMDIKPTLMDEGSGWITALVFLTICVIFIYALVLYLKNRNAKILIGSLDANIIRERRNIVENVQPLREEEKLTKTYDNIAAEQNNYLDQYKYQNSCENILKADNSYQSIIHEKQDMMLNWELMRNQEVEDDQDHISNQDRLRAVEELTVQDEMINHAFLIGRDELVRNKVLDRLGTQEQGLTINQSYERIHNNIIEDQEIRTRESSRHSQTRMDQLQGCSDKEKDVSTPRHFPPSSRCLPDSCNSSFNMIGYESDISEECNYNSRLVQSLIENTKQQAREEIWHAKEQLIKEVRETLRVQADIETKFTAFKSDVEKEISVNLDLISVALKNLRNSPSGAESISYAIEALNCLYTGMSFGLFMRKKGEDGYEKHAKIKLRRSI